MREIGIVKWFDLEKEYGYISRIEKHGDLHVKLSQLKCPATSIEEGAFVTYEIIGNGNRDAGEVRLLEQDSSVEIVEKAFYTNRNDIWQYGFKKYIPTVKKPDEKIINNIISKLSMNPRDASLIEYVPENFLLYSNKLHKFLTPDMKFKFQINLINTSVTSSDRDSNIIGLRDLLLKEADHNKKYWDEVPDSLLSENIIFEIAPKERLFRYYINELQSEKESNVSVTGFVRFLRGNRDLTKDVPEELAMRHDKLFPLMPSESQVNIAWDDLDNRWDKLSMRTKIMTIYRSAKENNKIDLIISKLKNNQEVNLLVRAYLLILSSKKYIDSYLNKGISPFLKSHEMIQKYFTDTNSISEETLFYILPKCNHHVTRLCEARKWITSDGNKIDSSGAELAFCPRKASSCTVGERGARIYSNTQKHWSHWTLAELLEECGLEPNLPELNNNDVYVLKLNGWINRLLEIRDRMKCSKCKTTMLANFKYAKNLAVYNSTVAHCRDKHESVYLTHCWACHKLIDSRESRHKFGDYYLCIHCGSGPKKSMNINYAQGDKCPKCYADDMDVLGEKLRMCSKCGHEIRLPQDRYLTGNLVNTD